MDCPLFCGRAANPFWGMSRCQCWHSRDWSRTCSWSDSRQKDRQPNTYIFQPVLVETLFNSSTLDYMRDLGRKIFHISGDDRDVFVSFSKNLGHDSTF